MDENNGSNEQLNVSKENISANFIINISTERSNTINNSTEKSYKANDITVDESNEVTVQNAAELAGTIAATSGRPLMEVIDEGQVDLISSDEIEFFGSLLPILSDPPRDFADAMDESGSPPKDTSSPSSLSSHTSEVGSRYEGRSLCAKAKGSRGAAVRQSPLLKPLSGKHVMPQTVASKPKGLRRSARLGELDL